MLTHALAILTLSTALAGAQDVRPTPPILPPAPLPERREVGPVASATVEVLMVHDVQDLTGHGELDALARDIVSDKVPMETRIELLDKYRALIEAGETRSAMQNIVETINALIQPPLTGERQKIEKIHDGALLLLGTPEQHQWVLDYLSSLRTFEGFIDIKATVYTLPPGRVGELLKGRSGVVLDAAELVQIRTNMAGADMLSSPRLIVNAGHRGTLSILDQTAYIKDYELTIVPGRDEEIADPVIDVIQTGLILDVRAAPVSATRMALHTEFTVTKAERPFPEAKLQLGARRMEVTVQLPEVHTMRAKGRFDLGAGSAVALGALGEVAELRADGDDRKGDDRELLVIIEVTRLATAPVEPR